MKEEEARPCPRRRMIEGRKSKQSRRVTRSLILTFNIFTPSPTFLSDSRVSGHNWPGISCIPAENSSQNHLFSSEKDSCLQATYSARIQKDVNPKLPHFRIVQQNPQSANRVFIKWMSDPCLSRRVHPNTTTYSRILYARQRHFSMKRANWL